MVDSFLPVSQYQFKWALYAVVVGMVQATGMAYVHGGWSWGGWIQYHVFLFIFVTA